MYRIYGPIHRQDNREDGRIASGSVIPGSQIEDMKEDQAVIRRNLEMHKRGEAKFSPDYIEYMHEKAKQIDEKLELVEESKPKIKGEDRDRLARLVKSMEEQIRPGESSITEMNPASGQRGADPHEDLEKEYSYDIKIDKEDLEAFGLERYYKNGKTQRKHAKKIWQEGTWALTGRAPNMDDLRKPGLTARYEPLTQEVPGFIPKVEVKADSTFEHKGREVEVIKKKQGRPSKH